MISMDVTCRSDDVWEVDWGAIAQQAEQTSARALARLQGLPSDISPERFIRAASALGPLDSYKHFGGPARNMVERIRASRGAPALRAFLRAVLGQTISMQQRDGSYLRLPPLCAQYHAAQLRRIAEDADTDADWLDLDDDLFQKEFGIAALRLYVAGSNLLDYRCGVPRSLVLRDGWRKAIDHFRFMQRLGGFRPFFQGHLHAFNLGALDEEGRNECYRCCAELYALHPECLGMFCSSWYYDPALDRISPWLSYLRTVPMQGGARLFFVETGGEAVANATATSRTRRRLYEQGRYMPRNYLFVWGRDDQIAWARAHRKVP